MPSPPTITITTPTSGEQLAPGAVSVSADFVSTSPIESVVISVALGSNKGVSLNSGTYNPGGYSGTVTHSIPNGTMTSGQMYYITATARDATGAVGAVSVAVLAAPGTVLPAFAPSQYSGGVTTPSRSLTWTLSTGVDQTHYQVQLLATSGGAVVWDTGIVESNDKTVTIPYPDTGVTRYYRVRAKRGPAYAWSGWGPSSAGQAMAVVHVPPQTPTVASLVATDVAGIALTHALVATITQPAAGAAPPAATTEIYVRPVGDPSNGVLVDILAGPATTYTYKSPAHGVSYQMRVRNVAADGRYAYSAWVTANAAVLLKGVVLFSLAAPTAVRLYRFNGDEAVDDLQRQAELIQYDGRPFPVVEFGTSSSRELKVTIDVKTDAERDQLRTMLQAGAIVLYRDRRGRKIYAFIEHDGFVDTSYGYRTTLTLTAIDYPPDRSA